MTETAWACDVLTPATDADVADVVALMNRAYRPRGGEAGWSNETDYIDGDRTSEDLLRREIAGNPGARLLICRRKDGDLQGCVWLEPLADDTWYLGSLTIEPRAQNGGVGRGLLAAAEEWVRAQGGRAIRMTVVQVRESLIAWYVRRGYRLTGETEPFPYEDTRFGIPKRSDLHFVVLRKELDRA
jgi:GNAT superfamily N-acetyltransferase